MSLHAHHRAVRAVAMLLLATVVAVAVDVGPVAAEPVYEPPVTAPVVDAFRPPTQPYGPGNRGLEYGTQPGVPVAAAADGQVVFAGLVAGARHITLLHDDGRRTTYSFLADLQVVRGQEVRRGAVLGHTGGHLHFSARDGDAYFDPAVLFGSGPPVVHLVPFDEPPGDGPSGERSAISQLVSGLGGLLGGAVDGAVGLAEEGAAWLQDNGGQLARTALHYAPLVLPVARLIQGSHVLAQAVRTAWERSRRPCTAPEVEVVPPPERRVVVTVAGLGSSSTTGSIDDIDTAALGFEAGDVVRFSYEGGRTPETGHHFPTISASHYAKDQSQLDLVEVGRRLADLIEDVAAVAPGVPLDVFAHSQGGLVTRLALLELEDRHGTAWLERLGVVATLATPHGGADLATAGHVLLETTVLGTIADVADRIHDLPLDPGAPTAAQLSETSDVVRHLAAEGVPTSVDLLSIAAREDYIVPVPRTEVDGATPAVVSVLTPTAHGDLPGSDVARRELGLALTGAPPTCESFADAFFDQLVGEGISAAEDQLGGALWGGLLGRSAGNLHAVWSGRPAAR